MSDYWKKYAESKKRSKKRSKKIEGPQHLSQILGIAGLLLILLKILKIIDWSWWYVTMPFWVGTAFILVVGGLYFWWLVIYTGFKLRRGKDVKKDKKD